MLPPPDAGFRLLGNRRGGSIDKVRLGLHEDAAVGLTKRNGGTGGTVEVLGH